MLIFGKLVEDEQVKDEKGVYHIICFPKKIRETNIYTTKISC